MRAVRLNIVLACVAFATALLWTTVAHAAISDPVLVTPAPGENLSPSVHDGRIVWADFTESDSPCIRLHAISTGHSTQLSPAGSACSDPDIHGDSVVWIESAGSYTTHVWLFRLETGKSKRLTSGYGSRTFPRVSNNWVVWVESAATGSGFAGKESVYAYDLRSGLTKQIVGYDNSIPGPLDISGSRLVWARTSKTGGAAGIDHIDLRGGSVKSLPLPQVISPMQLSLDGLRLAWCGETPSYRNYVYLSDLDSNSHRMISDTGSSATASSPALGGDIVAWSQQLTGGGSKHHLLSLDLGTGVQTDHSLLAGNRRGGTPATDGRYLAFILGSLGGPLRHDLYYVELKPPASGESSGEPTAVEPGTPTTQPAADSAETPAATTRTTEPSQSSSPVSGGDDSDKRQVTPKAEEAPSPLPMIVGLSLVGLAVLGVGAAILKRRAAPTPTPSL